LKWLLTDEMGPYVAGFAMETKDGR